MITSVKKMTAEELWRMSADDMRHELVNGELRTMAPAGFGHGIVGSRLLRKLLDYVEGHHLGVILNADTGFVLRRNPDTLRAPDVAFVKAARVPTGSRAEKFFEGAPDLAVEIVSPSDTVDDLEEKISDYLATGCLLVWVVRPKAKTITIHRSGNNPIILRENDQLSGEDVIAGFVCRVGDIFE